MQQKPGSFQSTMYIFQYNTCTRMQYAYIVYNYQLLYTRQMDEAQVVISTTFMRKNKPCKILY